MPATLAPKKPQPLGQLLLGRGLIEQSHLDRALDEQRRSNHRKLLGEILIELRQCTAEQIASTLAESYGVPFARVSPRLADPKVINVLPRTFIEKHQVLPLFLVEGMLTVAVSEPADVFLVEEIARVSGHRVQVVAATATDIAATLAAYLPGDQVFVIDDITPETEEGVEEMALLETGPDSTGSSPADRLLGRCLFNAVRNGANEIHIEPDGDAMRVRYRIDGKLTEKLRPPMQMHGPLVERIKFMAGIDNSEPALPREGSAQVRVDRKPIHLHIATLPARAGEKVTIRIVEKEKAALRLEKLGFGYDLLKKWKKLIARRRGLLLVTGPSGCGKQTTLYSILRELDAAELNICTVERSIACTLPGISQLEADDAGALSPSDAVRALLRQNPDVLMIDSLSDPQTARLAIEAAMTGQLVISSLPTPDSLSAIARLTQMGAEPYAVAAALSGVLSQRLVRRLCNTCKDPYQPTASEAKLLEKWSGPATRSPTAEPIAAGATNLLYRPKGCPQCNGTGFTGRLGIQELLVSDDALVELISRGMSSADLREWSRQSNLRTLRADGLEKVRAGLTTLDEVYRAAA